MGDYYQVERTIGLGSDPWCVVNGDGKRIKRFSSEDLMGAEELAEQMNEAYNAGFASGLSAREA